MYKSLSRNDIDDLVWRLEQAARKSEAYKQALIIPVLGSTDNVIKTTKKYLRIKDIVY